MAADRLGFRTVFANDFKQSACAVYRANFGSNALSECDIREAAVDVPVHDVLTAGFPCQPFSAAGKKQGVRDPRGTLFQVIVEILERTKPAYFVLENVKRLLTMEHGAHFATILSALSELNYRIEWRVLNASNFGLAQNRERIVICGRRIDVQAQEVRGASELARLATPAEIAQVVGLLAEADNTNWISIERHGRRFPNWGLATKGKFFAADLIGFWDASPRVLLQSVLEKAPSDIYDFTDRTLDRLEDNCSRNKFVQGVEIVSNQSGGARMGYTIFGVGGLAPTLTASTSRHYERYLIDGRFRRLTPIEYARLQGFPDGHCDAVTTYNQYELYGNAVPPPLAEWVLRRIVDVQGRHPFQYDEIPLEALNA